jgi:hypothetical protein
MFRFESRTGEFTYVASLREIVSLGKPKCGQPQGEPLGLNRARSHVGETRNQVIFPWAR